MRLKQTAINISCFSFTSLPFRLSLLNLQSALGGAALIARSEATNLPSGVIS